MESMFQNSVERGESNFCVRQEIFSFINMCFDTSEFLSAKFDFEALSIADIYEFFVCFPIVRMFDNVHVPISSYDVL